MRQDLWRRTRMLLLLASVLPAVGTPACAGEAPGRAFRVAFRSDGGAAEKRWLFRESRTRVVGGVRQIEAPGGFVVYRIEVGRARLLRVHVSARGGCLLRSSPDGRAWDTRFSVTGLSTSAFGDMGAGFLPAQQQAARASGVAYIRLSTAGAGGGPFLVKGLALEVIAATPPAGFKPSPTPGSIMWGTFDEPGFLLATRVLAGILILTLAIAFGVWWRTRLPDQPPRGAGKRPEDGLREIPLWVERYARNRTLAAIVLLAIMAVSVGVIGPLVYLTERAYRAGETTQAIVFLCISAACGTWLIWLSFVGARSLGRRIDDAAYAREGTAMTEPIVRAQSFSPHRTLAFALYFFCFIVWFGLHLLGIMPNRLWTAALYVLMAPFVFYFFLGRFRRAVSPFLLLWPALCAIHSLLLLLGAPIYIFGGPGGMYEILNGLIPVFGYALLCALAGHLYSRFALRRLRALARSPESPNGAQEVGG